MKKTIQILLIIILLAVLSLVVIFVFNPFNLRTKLISSVLNSYLSTTIKDYKPLDQNNNLDVQVIKETDKNPLLTEDQEKALESFGVDVSKLPTEITPETEACFFEKLGQERGTELVKGASPSALELFKIKSCLGM